jgi:hypothetical protein
MALTQFSDVMGFEFRYSAKHQKLEGGVLAFTSPAMRETFHLRNT